MKQTGLFFLFIFSFQINFAQTKENEPFKLSLSNTQEISITTNWKYQAGDNPEWAEADFDDSQWKMLNTRLWLDSLDENTFNKIGWFRLHLDVDSSLFNKTLALRMYQRGASEIYLDGQLVYTFGKVSEDYSKEKKYNPFGFPVSIVIKAKKHQVLAIRYSSTNAWYLKSIFGRFARTAGFSMSMSNLNETLADLVEELVESAFSSILLFGIFAALGFLHLVIFIFYPQQKANLYYGLFSILFGTTFLLEYIRKKTHQVDSVIWLNIGSFLLTFIALLFIVRLLYSLFYDKPPKQFYFFVLLLLLSVLASFNDSMSSITIASYFFFVIFETIRVIIVSIRKKKRWALTMGLGVILFVFCLIINAVALNLFGLSIPINPWMRFIINYVGLLSISFSMSIFLARDFARTNINLSKKIAQIQTLSKKSIEQEKEKQDILAKQNETLELQVNERTAEIENKKNEILEQNNELEQQNEEILRQRDAIQESREQLEEIFTQTTDSLHYAQYIQKAILGKQERFAELFKDGFILLRAKDIVSGDFYWYEEVLIGENNYKIAIAADCTGHGVPGAFMTVMGHDFLTDIVKTQYIVSPEKILYELDRKIANALRTNIDNDEQLSDGMDIAIMVYNEKTMEVNYSGAKNPLVHIRNNEVKEITASKFPIGSVHFKMDKVFQCVNITVQKGDVFYLFSDGFQDQFGGELGKKYMKSRFREFLFQIHHLPMLDQKTKLKEEIVRWRGETVQTDDILVMGVLI